MERSDLSANLQTREGLAGPGRSSSTAYPTSLGGQFRRHAPQYVAGTLALGAFQFAMNRIDWQSKTAIDAVFGPSPRERLAAGRDDARPRPGGVRHPRR